MRKSCRSPTHNYFDCWDSAHPNGYGAGIPLQNSLTLSVCRTWSYGGYIYCMVILSDKPLIVISLYLPNALQNHTHFRHQDVNNFLNPIITLASNSSWGIICRGDLNCFVLNEILDPNHSDFYHAPLHIIHSQMKLQGLVDAWRSAHGNEHGFAYVASSGTQSRLVNLYLSFDLISFLPM
jgi:exonuclease III